MTSTKETVIARGNKLFYLFPAIGSTSLLLVLLFDRKYKMVPFNLKAHEIAGFAVFVALAVGSWLQLLNNIGIKIKIDPEGIWTKKSSTISWSDMQFYYIDERSDRGIAIRELVFQSLSTGKQYKVLISSLDRPADEVLSVLELYADKHKIIKLT